MLAGFLPSTVWRVGSCCNPVHQLIKLFSTQIPCNFSCTFHDFCWSRRCRSLGHSTAPRSSTQQHGRVRCAYLCHLGVNPWSMENHAMEIVDTLPETNSKSTWKWMVGKLLSFWDGLFSGAMLNFGLWFPGYLLDVEIIYSSHNHGSVGKWVYLQDFFPSNQGSFPLNHDCGRKGRWLSR